MEMPKRLMSIDVLRGFDLFVLVALCPVLLGLRLDAPWYGAVVGQFTHTVWDGFTLWDMVMPLFMFLSGATIPFAMAKYREGRAPMGQFYWRIGKRVVLLWVLGMVVQGNLLSFSPLEFKPFSNTLQAIAIGYLFSALAFVYLPKWACYVGGAGLLVAYWAVMTFAGGGDYDPATNIAQRVDMAVFGWARDGATIDPVTRAVEFYPWYLYTWVLSSLNFVVTVLSGMLAGWLLRSESLSGAKKALRLGLAGVACIAAGWLWSFDIPIIKPIWTSSMTLVSSGFSILLLALFYYVIDVQGFRRGWGWLRVYGLNSIVAYVLAETPWVKAFCRSLTIGLKQYTTDYFPLVVEVSSIVVIFGILYLMYRNNKFLRV